LGTCREGVRDQGALQCGPASRQRFLPASPCPPSPNLRRPKHLRPPFFVAVTVYFLQCFMEMYTQSGVECRVKHVQCRPSACLHPPHRTSPMPVASYCGVHVLDTHTVEAGRATLAPAPSITPGSATSLGCDCSLPTQSHPSGASHCVLTHAQLESGKSCHFKQIMRI